MGVTTSADHKIEEAKNKLKEALKLLLEAMHPDCQGSDSFNQAYSENLFRETANLSRLIKKL